ncbi:MAG TPA: DoxX family protein [Gaiellaceae bacterium]|jgi:putative oxidoreductase|nr:DoxX family protein [Gaiellaceae bacterium]
MNGLGKLVLRATVGGYFVGHGMQKLAGWFGGGGPEGTGEHFEQIGLRPGRESALLAGASETGGGLLLALGLFTPAAVSMLTGVMTNAIRHVHWQNGLWVTEGGIEYPAVVLAVLAALADEGPGELSLDAVLGIRIRGPVVTAAAMGLGAAGAVYVAERGEQLFATVDADEALSRSVEKVGATG